MRTLTAVVMLLAAMVVEALTEEQCEMVRMRCAYRVGCGSALHSYMVDCADVLAGRTTRCPWACKRALISLTSTEEGQALVDCDCHGSEFCELSKQRVEVCRPEVTRATAEGTVVSCSVAQWICAADPLCSTALDYYHRLCRSMFHGRKCTPRCNNSLAILDRQEKAVKLKTCFCDGTEDFPCTHIRENTERLCYGREDTGWRENDLDDSDRSGQRGQSAPLLINTLIGTLALIAWTLLQSKSGPDG